MGLEDSVLKEGEEKGIRERRERRAMRMKMGFTCVDRWGTDEHNKYLVG